MKLLHLLPHLVSVNLWSICFSQQTPTSLPILDPLITGLRCLNLRGLAPPSQLALLESIQNAAIRVCIGTFRTSPSLSLCADAGLLPVHFRLLAFFTSLLSSITQFPRTSVHNYLLNTICSKPKALRAYTHIWAFLNHSLSRTTRFNCLLPVYSNSPRWTLSPPNIILKLTELPENSTNNLHILAHFHEILTSYTADGSRIRNRVGAAFSINNSLHNFRLRN